MSLRGLVCCLVAGLLAAGQVVAAEAGQFERELFKTRFDHEVAFRAAAIQVAWGAEALCDNVTEIEPFVLWSVHSLKKRLSGKELELLKQATGMDDKWRVVWMDESAPDELKLGDVVTAINGKPLPGGSSRIDLGGLFKGGSMVASDDLGFWEVVLKAREQSAEGTPMTLTLADGRQLQVDTQTGCAGSVTASAFDADPDQFWRQGAQRAKIPANAMLEARSRDEFRWLAAFGTYFQASENAIGRARSSEDRSTAFVVGKILMLAVPGAGMLLTAAEAQADKALAVDSVVGSADLFANEVVAALGGDPSAGLALNERLLAQGSKVDALLMGESRRSNAAEHARRLKALQAAQAKAAADAELAERRAQEEAQQRPLVLRPRAGGG
ncbi:MAG: hypothetical protein WAQ05_23895 [Rubrivivax sp.]